MASLELPNNFPVLQVPVVELMDRHKRAKVVPQDVIEIDEDAPAGDVVIDDGVTTGNKGKEKLTGYDNNLGNQMKVHKSAESNERLSSTDRTKDLRKFRPFKGYDTVGDYSDHHFAKMNYTLGQPPQKWAKVIQKEWRILEKDLPESIFVRVYEERMDLLRALIVGAAGTPYHDGLFFFDVFFPLTYPNVPPEVYYHSGGLGLNPNLYESGKVCLSLLNTWDGSKEERWIPRKSTMLQVLVSLQALVLNAKPFFNEAELGVMEGEPGVEDESDEYNERTFILSCRTMLFTLRRPPKHFEEYVVGHFLERAHAILVACKAYMEGAQVGCLVEGGVQDVDEGDKSCSQEFKTQVSSIVPTLVVAFLKNGSKNCAQFLPAMA